jgi:hypothetical protein
MNPECPLSCHEGQCKLQEILLDLFYRKVAKEILERSVRRSELVACPDFDVCIEQLEELFSENNKPEQTDTEIFPPDNNGKQKETQLGTKKAFVPNSHMPPPYMQEAYKTALETLGETYTQDVFQRVLHSLQEQYIDLRDPSEATSFAHYVRWYYGLNGKGEPRRKS